MEIPEIREQGILSGILIPVLSVGHLSQEEKSILNCLLHKHMSYQLPGLDPVMCYRSCIPPLPCTGAMWRIYKCPCGKPIAGGGGNMRPGGGYNTEQEAQVGARIILTGGV